jgi:hypothetical protein
LTQLVHAEWQKQLFPRKSSKLLERFTQSMVATFPTETRARLASVNTGRTVVVASASSGCTGTAVVPTLFGHADRGAKKMKVHPLLTCYKLDQLPQDVLGVTFSFLTPARVVFGVSFINKYLSFVCHDPLLWKRIYQTRWPSIKCAHFKKQVVAGPGGQGETRETETEDGGGVDAWEQGGVGVGAGVGMGMGAGVGVKVEDRHVQRRAPLEHQHDWMKYYMARRLAIKKIRLKGWKLIKKFKKKHVNAMKRTRKKKSSKVFVVMCHQTCGCNFVARDRKEMKQHRVGCQ